MKLSLAFLETRLEQMGSRCEPKTSTEDRNGYKPQGDFLHKAGLRLANINHAGDYAEFDMVERTGPGTISIRRFGYSVAELERGVQRLEADMLEKGTQDYATEWNWLQLSRALMLMNEPPEQARVAIMRGQAAQAPVCIGRDDGFDHVL